MFLASLGWRSFLKDNNHMGQPTSQPCIGRLIRCTEYSWARAKELQSRFGCASISETIEWLILCQVHPVDEAAAMFRQRKKRGGRGGVHVVPDHVELPPEG
jgi:hypothetical protein